MFILAFYNLLTFFTFRNWYVTGFLVQRDRDPWLIISYFVNGHAIIILQTTTYPRNSPSTYQNFIKLLEMWILLLSFTFYHYHDYHGQWCIKIKHGLVRQTNCKLQICVLFYVVLVFLKRGRGYEDISWKKIPQKPTIVNTMIKKEKHCKVKTQYKFTKHHIVKLKILTGALFFCNFQCILYISKTATFI